MTDLHIFEENLDRYARYDALIAHRIAEADVTKHEFCRTHKGELNLRCLLPNGKYLYYHSVNGAAEEAVQVFNKMDLGVNNVLFIYGVGIGYYYDAIKKWLHSDENRYLIFIEDDLAVLHCLFETENGARLLQDPQVIIQYFSREKEKFSNEFQDALFPVIRAFARGLCFLSTLTVYAATRSAICHEIRSQLFYGITIQSMQYGEMAHYMSLIFYNYYANTTQLFNSRLTPLTYGKFPGIPMVVVGAGPSLSHDIERIRSLQDKALIVASGTAMNVLNKNGIFPHLGGAIDPSTSQFSRLKTNFAFEIPYFYRPRLSNDALNALHGPKIYTNGFSNYRISHWFEEKLGIYTKQTFFTGISTTNFCLGLGTNLGCNPILFTGVDLSYTDAERYPKGVAAHPAESRGEHQELTARHRALLVGEGIDGNPVQTKMDWMIEAQYITDLKEFNPRTTYINCTSRGMRVSKIENMSLQDAEERFLNDKIELLDFIHAIVQNASMPWVKKGSVIETFGEWTQALSRCVEIIDKLKEEINRLWRRCEEGESLADARPYSGIQALLETELLEEEGYCYLLQDFNYVIDTMALSRQHKMKCHPELFTEKSLQLQKLEIELNYYAYYQSLARDHIALVKEVLDKFSEEESILDTLIPPPQIPEQPVDPSIDISTTFVNATIPESDRHIAVPPDSPYAEVFLSAEGKKHGQCLWIYPEGTTFSERYFRHGELHGPLRFFTKEGVLLSESLFVDGVREGKSVWYYRTGNPYATLRYRHGQPHGLQEYYFENGYAKSLLPFCDGTLHGEVVLYHRNGQKKREIIFKKGLLNGAERAWDAAGHLILESHYREGQPFGASRSWHSNGKLAREVTYHEDPSKFDLYEWDDTGTLTNKELALSTKEVEERMFREKRVMDALASFDLELQKIKMV